MILSLKTFTTLVRDMAAAAQASASWLLDLTVGSVLRAMLEANASIALWMQWLILQVLQASRAATASGIDLDSWMADFQVVRLPSVASSGGVTFSRFNSGLAAVVPVGAQVKTSDGARTYQVIADTTNGAWNGSNGFTMAIGTPSVTVTVVDVTAGVLGTAGNALANSITLVATAISAVDTATNSAAFTNGIDAETDAALRVRFQGYLASRARATPVAIAYAVSSVQQGLTFTIQENTDTMGDFTPGTFVVTVDDGTGAPSGALLAAILTAVDQVRPIGSQAYVEAPSVITANIAMTITCATSLQHTTAVPLVQQAIAAFIGALLVGGLLPYSVLAKLAYDASPYVLNVTGITLNSGTSDLAPTAAQVVRAGTIVIS